MDGDIGHELTKGSAGQLITQKVRRILRNRRQLAGYDQSDLEQHVRLELLRRLGRFDANRGNWLAFVCVVTNCVVASLLRDPQISGRSLNVVSLSTSVRTEGDSHTSLASILTVADHRRRTGCDGVGDSELADLALDVFELLGRLSADDRILCHRVMHDTVSEVARALGLPRSTLVDRLRRVGRESGIARVPIYGKEGP